MFVLICVFLGASSCSPLLGVLGRSRGAPGALLDALLGVPAAPSERLAAKEARPYATFCENRCQVRDFLKSFRFLRENSEKERGFWRVSISPWQSGLLRRARGASGRCRGAPGALLDALRGVPAAPSEPHPAKEARGYATLCENCCHVCHFEKYFWLLWINLEKMMSYFCIFGDVWRVSSFL